MTPNFRLFLIALALLLGVAKCAVSAPMQAYETLTAAAVAGLDDADALAPEHEAGGAIYQCGAIFAYTPLVTQHKRDRVDIPVGHADGCTLVANFHTHPSGDTRLSNSDIASTCRYHIMAFMRPKGGALVTFDCRALSDAAISVTLARNK